MAVFMSCTERNAYWLNPLWLSNSECVDTKTTYRRMCDSHALASSHNHYDTHHIYRSNAVENQQNISNENDPPIIANDNCNK